MSAEAAPRTRPRALGIGAAALTAWLSAATGVAATATGEAEPRCQALVRSDNVTIFHAGLRVTSDGATPYCYAKGLIAGRITYHVQLPLPDRWNGRFIHLGDGGADGDLDYADTFIALGYAVANSNTGHDVGAAGDAYGYADDVRRRGLCVARGAPHDERRQGGRRQLLYEGAGIRLSRRLLHRRTPGIGRSTGFSR